MQEAGLVSLTATAATWRPARKEDGTFRKFFDFSLAACTASLWSPENNGRLLILFSFPIRRFSGDEAFAGSEGQGTVDAGLELGVVVEGQAVRTRSSKTRTAPRL